MTAPEGGFRPVAEILDRLPASRRDEVQHRAGQGDIPYLPEDVGLDVGRAFFPGVGWVDAPGLDPARLPIDDIELFFIIVRGQGYTLEAALKTAVPLSDDFEAMQKLSAFRKKSALQKYLRKAAPTVAAEVKSRLSRGQLAFLPDQLRFEPGRLHFLPGGGSIAMPGFDPKDMPMQNMVLLFIVPTSEGNKMEIIWRAD
ncbi:MAG: hypothetical protein QOD93_6437 [Acetobacteraceae bacterium]|nr:hypothetical protein [Rhodopila sp.]MEA2773475.1 hypothetical protein [Acetobacteraceae bacterium]